MKIDLELPDWCDERNIWIMAGIELAAFKLQADDGFKVKTARCSNCGECCQKLSSNFYMQTRENGDCLELEKDGTKYRCGLLINRPFRCSISIGREKTGRYQNCTVEYK